MLILFDEATPLPLRPFLKGHLVRTTFQQGWAGLTNGSLIEVAEQAGFQLLLTTIEISGINKILRHAGSPSSSSLGNNGPRFVLTSTKLCRL